MSEQAPLYENLSSQFELAKRQFRSDILENYVLRAVMPADAHEATLQPYLRGLEYGIVKTVLTPEWHKGKIIIDRLDHLFVPVINFSYEFQGKMMLSAVAPSFHSMSSGRGFHSSDIESAAHVFERAAARFRNTLPQGSLRLDQDHFIWRLNTF